MKRVGLTLGKFAPFHKGHQYLVETALTEMDAVKVIIYSADDVTDLPLAVRAQWIRTLYPAVSVIEAHDGPQCVGDSPEVKRLHEEYVLNTLGISGITHFYSSEFYGAHMSRALGAENRLVDPERSKVPISASMIRESPFRFRAFLSPLVYRDLVTRVVFLGAPSTGKTTIAREMAHHLDTCWMPEYGREYWHQHQRERQLSLEQLLELACEHRQREERMLYASNRYLFTDTNALTTVIFSRYYHGRALTALEDLARQDEKRYHYIFLCDMDIPYENTWDRSGDMVRNLFQQEIRKDLDQRGVTYTLLTGNLIKRVETVKRILQSKSH